MHFIILFNFWLVIIVIEEKFKKKKIKKINILIKYSIEQIISYGCFEKLLAKIKIYKNN